MTDRNAQHRYLIVNADDFGQSAGINRGIIAARENGIVTSTSLMVRFRAVAEAGAYARRNPEFAVGLHIDLGEWRFRNDQWEPVYEVVPLSDPLAVGEEVRRQVGAFDALVGRPPTHLDSHQHVHLRESVFPVVQEIADRVGVPVRQRSSIRYCGAFYGQTADGAPMPEAIRSQSLIKIVRELERGWTELGCHPGYGNDLDTMYALEREREVEALCDPAVRATVADCGIELRSFGDFI
ncbi:MAG: ChbG/HpnK family deacetylase [Acidobacteriia bacterium]|nr:ChbG/HpnK family deacetylase [Terriglobia bacterium]